MAGYRRGSADCRSAAARCRLAVTLAGVALAGCAVAPLPPAPLPPAPQSPAPLPPAVAPVARPTPVPAPAVPATVPGPQPAPPSPSAPAAAPTVPPITVPSAPSPASARAEARARYERVTFAGLPAVAERDWLAAWPAFLQSCLALAAQPAWKDVCSRAAAVDRQSATAVRGFFASAFEAWRVRSVAADAKPVEVRDSGLVTGYYEPLLRGSRKPSAQYHVPIYRVPDDLVSVDLASVHPELATLRLRGRLDGRRIVPYSTRGEIQAGHALRGQELLWVDDPVEAFFLQVQGSGRVQLDDGRIARLGYGDTNGHPYRSIGRWLVDRGELTLDQASMQGIKAWAALNPQRLNQLLEQNPSFVFFRELPLGDPSAGPLGALGVPLTPHASVAVDPRFVPLGAPLVLSSRDPTTGAAFARPMMAQDTGSAIRGPLRFDYFWGFGAEAGERAGRQKHEGSAWLLTPRGIAPEALLKR